MIGKTFVPHAFKNQVFFNFEVPRIFLTPRAFQDQADIVAACDKEVGWMGAVREMPGGDLLVEEIFLIEQQASTATCEIMPDGLVKFAEELFTTREDGPEVFNRIRLWGHSHCHMEVFASQQDDSQLQEFINHGEVQDFFLRVIANKRGKMSFTLVNVADGYTVQDAEWQLFIPEIEDRYDYWKAQVDEKVKSMGYSYGSYVPNKQYNGYTPPGRRNPWDDDDKVSSPKGKDKGGGKRGKPEGSVTGPGNQGKAYGYGDEWDYYQEVYAQDEGYRSGSHEPDDVKHRDLYLVNGEYLTEDELDELERKLRLDPSTKDASDLMLSQELKKLGLG